MSIAFDCEKCGRSYQVAGDLAGKRCRCKHCGHSFTIPAASGPTLDEIYALETDIPQSEPKEEAPSPRLNDKRKRTKVSGLFGLSGLPLWGFNVYRGVIAAVLIAALVVDGVPKLILALAVLSSAWALSSLQDSPIDSESPSATARSPASCTCSSCPIAFTIG